MKEAAVGVRRRRVTFATGLCPGKLAESLLRCGCVGGNAPPAGPDEQQKHPCFLAKQGVERGCGREFQPVPAQPGAPGCVCRKRKVR